MEAFAAHSPRFYPPRSPEELEAIALRAAARTKAKLEATKAKREAIKLEKAKLEVKRAPPPVADVASSDEVLAAATALLRAGDASVQVRALAILADALGLTKGGARSAGGDAETREVVSAVVLESALAVALAREREATRARMRGAGMGEDAINAILGEGEA